MSDVSNNENERKKMKLEELRKLSLTFIRDFNNPVLLEKYNKFFDFNEEDKRYFKEKELHEEERRYIINECTKIPNPMFCTFTLKQSLVQNRIHVKKTDSFDIQKNTETFFNILTQKFYHNNRNNKIIKRVVMICKHRPHHKKNPKINNDTSRYHLHTIIERPEHIKRNEFIDYVDLSFKKTYFAYNQINIREPKDLEDELSIYLYITNRDNFTPLEMNKERDSYCDYLNSTFPSPKVVH